MTIQIGKYRKTYEQFYESSCYGTVEVLGRAPNNSQIHIRFIETGYESFVSAGKLITGNVQDSIARKAKQDAWKEHNEDFESNSGEKLVAYAKRGAKFKVRFVGTGYETEAYIENVKSGKIRDPYVKSFMGVGYTGEFVKVSYWKPARQLWSNMVKRCYNPKDYMGYFGESFVDDRWLCFANFLEDLPHLDNFDKWLVGKGGGPVYNLDKDLKFPGNKVYSKDACAFVTEYENKSAGAINARLLDKTNGRYGGQVKE